MSQDTLPAIATPRLRLRRLTKADAAALFGIFSDPEVVRYWSSPALTDMAEAVEMVELIDEAIAHGRLLKWGIALADDDRVIGTCTLFHIDRDNRRAELGYVLGRAHWRRGLMREALAALLDHAFDPMGLHRLEADVDPRNAASIGLLERLGFAREGLLRERWHVNGEVQDALFYGLLRPEWQSRRASL